MFVRSAGIVRLVARRVEPDPQTWWETYGHRIVGSAPGAAGASEPGAGPATAPDPGRVGPVGPADPSRRARPVAGVAAADPGAPARPRPASPTASRPRLPAADSEPRPAAAPELPGRGRARPEPGPAPDRQGRRRGLRATSRGRAQCERLARIRVPLEQPRRIAVTSLKGGVGKTTVTALLGLTLAELRGDRVVALDANPDAGTLADRLSGPATPSVRDLLRDLPAADSWTALARHTGLAGRLHVLASEQDPAAAEGFRRDEYEAVLAVLARYFTVILTDSGTGLVHPAMEATLALADGLVVVGSQTVDAIDRASRTLDRLDARGRGDLVAGAVVVLCGDRRSPGIDMGRVRAHFGARCRAVAELPADPHLVTGGRIDTRRLRPATRLAVQELAAVVADGFGPGEGRR